VEGDPADIDASFSRKLRRTTYSPVISLAVLVLSLLLLVGFLMWTFGKVNHTNRVIAQGLRAEKLLLDLQAATRGFYLTDDPSFLSAYGNSRSELPEVLADLRRMVRDNPAQAERAVEIERASRVWLAWTATAIVPKAAGLTTTEPTTQAVQEDRARFDHLSGDIAAFLRTEYELRDQRARRAVRTGWWSLGLALAASTIVALLQCRGIRRQVESITAAYREVLRLARDRRLRAQEVLQELDHELKAVGDIQRSLLPLRLPSIPGLELAASYQTSRRAGGDYYDFFRLPPEHADDPRVRYGILIADVSGHGTPAAVLMAVTHSIAHGFERPTHPPSDLLEFVNRRLCDSYTVNTGTFVTAFYAIYDPETRELTYSSAGHNPPRLRRAGSDRFEELPVEPGYPLGVDRDERYATATHVLAPGDMLVLYTDGITEARNDRDEQLGVQRLDQAMLGACCEPNEMLASTLAFVRDFGGEVPEDDRTLLVMRVCDSPCAEATHEVQRQTIVVDTPINPLAGLRA
jgi:serine phosphatase RsbU (regulator of sigma subunit)/CHASE3 domain sensor protein